MHACDSGGGSLSSGGGSSAATGGPCGRWGHAACLVTSAAASDITPAASTDPSTTTASMFVFGGLNKEAMIGTGKTTPNRLWWPCFPAYIALLDRL